MRGTKARLAGAQQGQQGSRLPMRCALWQRRAALDSPRSAIKTCENDREAHHRTRPLNGALQHDHLRNGVLNEANMEELLRTTIFTPGELLLRLAVASLCGIVIGIDREMRGFAAGIRTHALVSLSSALITISALMLYHEIRESGDAAPDPLRVIQGLAQAVGFIGAGAIFVARGSVKNLTTAANIWLSAALGIASGAGQFLLVLLGTGFGAFIVSLVWLLERFVTANSPLEHASSDDDRREANHSAE